MTAVERIQVLDQLMHHYFECQNNLFLNYKNQLEIFIGVQADSLRYNETLLQPELIMHPLYEPIYTQGEDFISELETLRFEQEYYLKKIDTAKKKGLENYDFFIEKLKELVHTSEKLQKENDWVIKKSHIHDLIFKQKMPKNFEQVKQITSILNSDFYNEIDNLPIAENISRLLDALEMVVPIYENILNNNTYCKPLKEIVKIINRTENIDVKNNSLFADGSSISDFLYLWNIKKMNQIENASYKIAKTNNVLYHINKSGWSDAVLVTKQENNILVSDEILVFDSDVINPKYLLLLLNLPCYKEIGHYYYHRKNSSNAVLDLSIVIPAVEVQDYFAEAIDKYFIIQAKSDTINKIMIEAKDILKEQGETAANYFLDMSLKIR
jgi:hypothetical protein